MRLEGKIAVVIGAGQSPGETLGNGRATVLRLVQEEGVSALYSDEQAAMIEKGNCVRSREDSPRDDW